MTRQVISWEVFKKQRFPRDNVLVLLFVKYVSDKAASQKNYLLEVPQGGRFADMVALKGHKEIGDKMNKIISRLAEANDLKGVIDVADFNDADKLGKGKEMVDPPAHHVFDFCLRFLAKSAPAAIVPALWKKSSSLAVAPRG